MPPDADRILAVAETERRGAHLALTAHIADAGWNEDCPDCRRLLAHAERTEHQVDLLVQAEVESEALF